MTGPVFSTTRKAGFLILGIGVTLFLGTCGIDDYIYLEYVSDNLVTADLNNRVTVSSLPSQNTYFRNYEIFYRLYISDSMVLSTIGSGQLSTINTSLSSDYSAILPYTDKTSTATTSTNIASFFSGRNYYPLDFQDNYTLRSGGFIIDFAGTNPSPVLFDQYQTPHYLYRSYSMSNLSASDRLLVNTMDLNSSQNANVNKNADVQDKSGISGSRYVYINMYMVAYGIDNNYSPIYSKPTWLGVFLLPNSSTASS
jgi:hypothetical protein